MTITKDTHPNLWLFLSAAFDESAEADHQAMTEFVLDLDHKAVDQTEAMLDHVYDDAFGEK